MTRSRGLTRKVYPYFSSYQESHMSIFWRMASPLDSPRVWVEKPEPSVTRASPCACWAQGQTEDVWHGRGHGRRFEHLSSFQVSNQLPRQDALQQFILYTSYISKLARLAARISTWTPAPVTACVGTKQWLPRGRTWNLQKEIKLWVRHETWRPVNTPRTSLPSNKNQLKWELKCFMLLLVWF